VLARVIVLIVSLGGCAAVLLAARQARVQAAHDLAEARLRIVERDHELWRVRARIAARVTPQHVQQVAAALTPLKPIAPELDPALLPRDERIVQAPGIEPAANGRREDDR
jgi:hypothetical protein